MDWTRLKSWSAVWLLLGLLVPALFLLDYVVKRSGSRQVWLTTELKVQADGQDPLLLAADLEGRIERGGLEVIGADVLRENRYPWRPIAIEGTFMLRLDREFLSSTAPGERRTGFAASYRVRMVDRADGFGTPAAPCMGEIHVLQLELVCTSPGRDLLWRTSDDRGWIIQGPLNLAAGRRP